MIISDLEYREIVSPLMGNDTVKKVKGGFFGGFVFANVEAFAQGSVFAKVETESKTVIKLYPFQV